MLRKGNTINVRGIDYIVISTYRLVDKHPELADKPYAYNIAITAKRPRGKKLYDIVQYPSGVFSNAVGRP